MRNIRQYINRVGLLVIGAVFAGLIIAPSVFATKTVTTWSPVGQAEFSDGWADQTSLTIDSNDVPYVSYRDAGKGVVMKLDNGSWQSVSPTSFSGTNQILHPSLAIDSNDALYIAYGDGGSGNKLKVKKLVGTNWQSVGNASGFSDGEAAEASLAIDPSNNLYVSYMNYSSSKKITVKKFSGGSWQTVGAAEFSDGEVDTSSIAIDSLGMAYVSYIDKANGDKATVMKFNGTNWVSVGADKISESNAFFMSRLAFDSTDAPYLVFADGGKGNLSFVKKFDGVSWVSVGSDLYTEQVRDPDLAFDSSGTLYLGSTGYSPEENGYIATVQKFSGGNWQAVGIKAGDKTAYNKLAFDSADTPYFFVPTKDSNNDPYLATVKTPHSVVVNDNQRTISGDTSSLPIRLTMPSSSDIISFSSAASVTPDGDYRYPLNLVDFSATVTSGSTNQIVLTFETDLKPNDVTARKYDSTTKQYTNLLGATVTETTLSGKHALELTYKVTDGGALDQDGVINGVIVDPVGLATIAGNDPAGNNPIGNNSGGGSNNSSVNNSGINAPNTGYGTPSSSTDPLITALITGAVISTAAGLALLYRQKRTK